jgi:hypothetical protein
MDFRLFPGGLIDGGELGRLLRNLRWIGKVEVGGGKVFGDLGMICRVPDYSGIMKE